MDETFKRLIPDLRGLIDPKAEQRIFLAFTQMYNYYDQMIREQQKTFDSKLATQAATIEKQSALLNSFATPLIGVTNPTNPLATLGVGTITKFTADPSAIFTVTNANGPTTALSIKVQVKNKFLSGPTTGADAVPTFRSIVADDLTGIDTNDDILDWLAQ